MDWTKAKNILIVALLVTNLILIFFIVDSYNDKEDDGQILQETIDYLQDHGVTISVDIPEKRRRMSTLTVKYRATDEEKVKTALEGLERLGSSDPSEDEVVNLANSAVRAVGLMSENVVLDQVIPEEDGSFTVTYQDVVEGYRVEESTIRCAIRDGGVVDLEWDWLEPVKFSRAKRKILPAAEALMNFRFELYHQRLEKIREKTGITEGALSASTGAEPGNPSRGSISAGGIKDGRPVVEITGLEVVYWLNPQGVSSDVQLSEDTAYPAWKISYRKGDGEVRTMYVDAMGDLTK